MCGFCGFVNFDEKISLQENQKNLKKMVDSIIFRGPDDEGMIIEGKNKIFLGHRRLSILDLSKNGHQPFFSHNQRFVIIYNGEIYNHLKLREKIESTHVIKWKSTSDTETLIENINIFGIKNTLENIKGMFSFALLDKKEEKIYLARDQSGEKPLYYGFNNNCFYFGSDLRSFFASSNFNPIIDYNSLTYFFKYGFIPEPHSIIK